MTTGIVPINYRVLISGHQFNVTDENITPGNMQIGLSIGRRSTASFEVYQTDGRYHFQHSENVKIYDDNAPHGTLVFSGYIDAPTERYLGQKNLLMTKCSCVDEHYLADKRIYKTHTWVNQTAGAIVRSILSTVLVQEGVTAGIINAGPVLPEFTTQYETCASLMDRLATAANFWWAIDQYKALQFQSYTTTFAPWAFTGAEAEYGSLTVTRNNPAYRNKQYLIGAKEKTKKRTEYFKADGTVNAWVTQYQIAEQPDIYVNGVKKLVGGKGSDTGKDFYATIGDPVIARDDFVGTLPAGALIRVDYVGQYDVVVVSQNDQQVSQQKAIEQYTSGIVEEVESDPLVTDSKKGLSKVRQLLARYGAYGQIVQFTTRQLGLEPGQLLKATYPPHELFNAELLIESVDITDRDGINLWYTVKAILGPYDVTWVDFYASLLKRGAIYADQANLTVADIVANIITFSAEVHVDSNWYVTPSLAIICGGFAICGERETLLCGLLYSGATNVLSAPTICGFALTSGAIICGAILGINTSICDVTTLCGTIYCQTALICGYREPICGALFFLVCGAFTCNTTTILGSAELICG